MRFFCRKHNGLCAVATAAAALAVLVTPLSAAQLHKSDVAAYRTAFAAAETGDWPAVVKQIGTAREKLPAKILAWMRYRTANSGAPFAEIAGFIRANPTWPDMTLLRRRAEEAIGNDTGNAELVTWFREYPPTTAPGSVQYARALIDTGQKDTAARFIRQAWESLNMTPVEETGFRKEFQSYLSSKDHIARLDRLIWEQQVAAAKRQMRYVGSDYRYLAEARLKLMGRDGGVDNAVARVPEALRSDPGLIYERLRWRRRKDFNDSAVELLKMPPGDLKYPEKWWIERAILARDALRSGDITLAYRLARDHGALSGAELAEAEWLAGWIALRFLSDNTVALNHFANMYQNVRYPVSRARGAYWAGRAADAAGVTARAEAQKWYGAAAKHFSTYYGQLALSRLSIPKVPIGDPVPSEQDVNNFNGQESVRVVRMLAELEQTDLLETFFKNLVANTTGQTQWVLVAKLTHEIDRHDLTVRVAKSAIRDGVVLADTGYPSLPVALDIPANPVLVHAVIRQESAFDIRAVSGAGARGLMQLMPATAKGLARQLNVPHSDKQLTSDPRHNLNLGSAYLAQMIDNFDGSIVLALAAYNAGPGRVQRWLAEYGDPRNNSLLDAVDWVESIPYPETRNYVQRVLENFTVYGYRLHDQFDPLTIVDALTGSTRVNIP
jgi:soluble lytic murein transglycosylase